MSTQTGHSVGALLGQIHKSYTRRVGGQNTGGQKKAGIIYYQCQNTGKSQNLV